VPVTLYPAAGGTGRGLLGAKPAAAQGLEKLYDDVTFGGAQLAAAEESANRLIYATPELTAPVHLSGFARVTIRLASSKPAANLSVWLVQLPWTEGPIGPANLITRGWADPQNAAALTHGGNYASKTAGVPLVPGRFVTMTFDLEPDDQIVPAGKRIGLMIFSSDRDFTLWPKPGTELTVDLDGTSVMLPIVGGPAALARGIR
jgi:X-Pro dipeptidyl-peptidase